MALKDKKELANYNKGYRSSHRELIYTIQKRFRHTSKGKFIDYRFGAKRRGLEFSLTFKEFEDFVGKECEYCGTKLLQVGIDRKDNEKGYTKENSVPCCSMCNFMKHNLNANVFIEQVHKISKNN